MLDTLTHFDAEILANRLEDTELINELSKDFPDYLIAVLDTKAYIELMEDYLSYAPVATDLLDGSFSDNEERIKNFICKIKKLGSSTLLVFSEGGMDPTFFYYPTFNSLLHQLGYGYGKLNNSIFPAAVTEWLKKYAGNFPNDGCVWTNGSYVYPVESIFSPDWSKKYNPAIIWSNVRN